LESGEVSVTLATVGNTFKGFFVQALNAEDETKPIGTLIEVSLSHITSLAGIFA